MLISTYFVKRAQVAAQGEMRAGHDASFAGAADIADAIGPQGGAR
jgi:hypothetical protein